MSRLDYMQDRVKITRRVPTLNRGVVENDPNIEEGRVPVSDWIPARLRKVGGSESQSKEVKMDLPISYELVMLAVDNSGRKVRPRQHDRFIVQYARSTDVGQEPVLNDISQRLRITGTIKEVRKRARIYSYVIPVILDVEF